MREEDTGIIVLKDYDTVYTWWTLVNGQWRLRDTLPEILRGNKLTINDERVSYNGDSYIKFKEFKYLNKQRGDEFTHVNHYRKEEKEPEQSIEQLESRQETLIVDPRLQKQ